MNNILNFKSITTYRLKLPLKFNFKTAKGEVKERETIVVRIEDQQGYVGYGECVAFTEPFYTFETVETCWKAMVDDYIFNLRLMRPKSLMTYVRQLQFWRNRDNMPMAIAALENALIHLHCERIGVNSVSYIMDQPLQETIESGIVVGDVPIDQLLDVVAHHVVNGCKRIKLKVNPIDGYERVALVRKHYPDLVLAADANRSYSYQEIDKVRQYDDLGLACIEEPFAMANLQSYKDWKWERLNHGDWKIYTPICLDESILGYDDLSYAIEYGLIDVLNIKVGRMGGLIPTKAAINLCRERHIPYWIGSMADLTFNEGVMQVPDGDGLGVTVFDDRLETYCMEKRTL